MPEITKDKMVGKTVLRVEAVPASIEVIYTEKGTQMIQNFTSEGSLNDIHRRVSSLISTLNRHTKTPKPLAHSLVSNDLPTDLLEY